MGNISFPEPDPQKGELLVLVNPRLFTPEQTARLVKTAFAIYQENVERQKETTPLVLKQRD
jgi:hypothetical protein